MSVAKKVIFKGRVQGVGFRFTTFNIANKYDVTGYVRNCSDGTVEMHVQGTPGQVQSLIEDVKNYFESNITDIDQKKTKWDDNFQDFKITF